ncbi:hypothetical protein SEVIR_9G397200v4 [Setaria viridis]|uniref:Uncharacterized protein n=1 Tax=Setaria viridis TaxID=4556 RepID=A0A4V6D1T1_SETVI|nr:hypothetical protein SEVIR_9G397200v2 [Setaria viridis]
MGERAATRMWRSWRSRPCASGAPVARSGSTSSDHAQVELRAVWSDIERTRGQAAGTGGEWVGKLHMSDERDCERSASTRRWRSTRNGRANTSCRRARGRRQRRDAGGSHSWKPQFSPNADLTVSSVLGARVDLVYHRLSILTRGEQAAAGAMRAVRARGKKKERENGARGIGEECASRKYAGRENMRGKRVFFRVANFLG